MCLSWDFLGRALVFNYSPIYFLSPKKTIYSPKGKKSFLKEEKQVGSLSDFASTHFFFLMCTRTDKSVSYFICCLNERDLCSCFCFFPKKRQEVKKKGGGKEHNCLHI